MACGAEVSCLLTNLIAWPDPPRQEINSIVCCSGETVKEELKRSLYGAVRFRAVWLRLAELACLLACLPAMLLALTVEWHGGYRLASVQLSAGNSLPLDLACMLSLRSSPCIASLPLLRPHPMAPPRPRRRPLRPAAAPPAWR